MLKYIYSVKKADKIEVEKMGKVIKETLHANGMNIGIYTQDFENEFN